MEKQTNITVLNTLIISTLVFNLFIFTSRMSFLPWYIEDGWGYLGLVFTSFIFLLCFFQSSKLHKDRKLTTLQKFIPLASAILSIFVLITPSSDFMTILANLINTIILTIYITVFQTNPNVRNEKQLH
ncbi:MULTISPECIES: hypothetical protein [Bacillus cereus group]|uniref:Group-specific protein n=1 Tax=Bacillus wiedmannii TaxID=1890302 RepID=A0ABD6TIM8_9BACI|nr:MULTISPECIES: hypothetical protein [Bacillus cereus group]KAA0789751.1 hypothetical protein DN394_13210 [Bacillus sp. BB081]PEA75343.1 hypothetical protein CON92_25035 [Bacillus wiedmannii]PEG07555.1 hypothetical protein CON96_25145 [Bacillus wiedmannii]PEI73380.1 hypothetical protein CN905_21655 [Bacillus wiedmannii]PEJ47181.1 hypothetical protein CN676_23510 [Bacillus wiedmannii]